MAGPHTKENPKEHWQAAELFNRVYSEITRVVPYKPEWRENTTQFPGIAKDPELQNLAIGEMVKFADEQDRKVIVVGTDLGPAVVFQRYRKFHTSFRLNAPEPIMELSHRFRGFLGIEQMSRLLLHPDELPTKA